MAIFFHTIDIDPRLKHKTALKSWINDCVLAENKKTGDINVIFCSDDYLLELNRTHLNHNYFTDIITFDFTTKEVLSGDLYISFERVQDNALHNEIQLETELYRVIIHGVMHLCGYKDKTKKEALLMRAQEEKCLKKITF
jgi:rRNA maturation RNase YbeY